MNNELIKLTQYRLKEIIDYNFYTGIFTNRVTRGPNAVKGKESGSLFTSCGKTYRSIMVDGKHYLSHRLAFLWMDGCFPENNVDHIDGNGLNNTFLNLRRVTSRQNSMNARLSVTNKSGHIGICWSKEKRKWRANIKDNGKQVHLGYHSNLEVAITVRKGAEGWHGYHKNHGSIRPL